MIIYNITFHIENAILEECLVFLKETYIPTALKNEILDAPRLCKVLGKSEDDSSSYALQFQVESVEKLNDWWKCNGEELNALLVKQFAGKVMGFTTLLEQLEHRPV